MLIRRLSNGLTLFLVCCIVLFVIFWLTRAWILRSPFVYIYSPEDDYVQRVLGTATIRNAADFGRWYKANIAIQTTAIISSIIATILASLTNENNTKIIKYFSIFLTAITSLLIAGKSTFHVRENLNSFININSNLSNLQFEYSDELASMSENKKTKEKVQRDIMEKYNNSVRIRWGAYAIIGQQQLGPESK